MKKWQNIINNGKNLPNNIADFEIHPFLDLFSIKYCIFHMKKKMCELENIFLYIKKCLKKNTESRLKKTRFSYQKHHFLHQKSSKTLKNTSKTPKNTSKTLRNTQKHLKNAYFRLKTPQKRLFSPQKHPKKNQNAPQKTPFRGYKRWPCCCLPRHPRGVFCSPRALLWPRLPVLNRGK
jgi:hypothetical protein